MNNYIDICKKVSERCAEYPEQNTAHFENVANITAGSDSVIPQEKQKMIKTIEQKSSETIEQNARKTFLPCLSNLLAETKLMAATLEKSITRNWMTGMEKTAQILVPTTEIGESIKYSMGISNPFRADTLNRTDPTIQPTTAHCNQAAGLGHSDKNHFPLVILDSGTDVPKSGWNIDNRTGINPQGPIVTTIP